MKARVSQERISQNVYCEEWRGQSKSTFLVFQQICAKQDFLILTLSFQRHSVQNKSGTSFKIDTKRIYSSKSSTCEVHECSRTNYRSDVTSHGLHCVGNSIIVIDVTPSTSSYRSLQTYLQHSFKRAIISSLKGHTFMF